MRVEFDPDSDVLLIHLKESEAKTRGRSIDERRIVHVDASGEPILVELLLVSLGVDLTGLPQQAEIAAALQAFPVLAA